MNYSESKDQISSKSSKMINSFVAHEQRPKLMKISATVLGREQVEGQQRDSMRSVNDSTFDNVGGSTTEGGPSPFLQEQSRQAASQDLFYYNSLLPST